MTEEMATVDANICVALLGGEELRLPVPIGGTTGRHLRALVAAARHLRVQQVRLLQQDGTTLTDMEDVPPNAVIKCILRPLIPRAPDTWYTPARYTLGTAIGCGAYASVCEAYDTDRHEPVAIKRCSNIFDDLVDGKRVLRELAILQALDHDCVVRLHDAFRPPQSETLYEACVEMNEMYMVMELCDSDLKKLIRHDVRLGMDHVSLLLYNLLRGLKYLHSAGVYHRDLKPANCLVNQDCSLKLADFNLSCVVGEPNLEEERIGAGSARPGGTVARRQMTQHVITRWYRAPEVILLNQYYTEAIDVWSAGCILAELLQMLPDGPEVQDRGPLFQGRACYPLSPRRQQTHKDQLHFIFELLGTPSEAAITRLVREDARDYVQSFTSRAGAGLSSRFPYVFGDALDLVEKMLRFDQLERISVDESLGHTLLARCRDESKETVAAARISLDFEQERCIDEEWLVRNFLKLFGQAGGA